ncbi:hypothetical protein HY624_04390 [Candidatus Uhrbacteria bacterium]|nr:hypothetical protein [Candidatus Uhrbacteria bacterium]
MRTNFRLSVRRLLFATVMLSLVLSLGGGAVSTSAFSGGSFTAPVPMMAPPPLPSHGEPGTPTEKYWDECDPRHPDWVGSWTKKYGENEWPDVYRLFQDICYARRESILQDIRNQLNQVKQTESRLKYAKDIDRAVLQQELAALKSELESFQSSLAAARQAIADLLNVRGSSLVQLLNALDTAGIDAAFTRLSDHQAARDAYNNVRFWERMNAITTPIEVREQLANIEKDLKALTKKSFLKKVTFIKKILPSFSQEPIATRLEDWKEIIDDVRGALQEADYEEARELMGDMWQMGSPSDVKWFVNRLHQSLKEIDTGLEVLIEEVGIDDTFKTKLRTFILGLFEPIVKYWNAGKNVQVIQRLFDRVEEQLRELGESLRGSIEKQLDRPQGFRIDQLQKDKALSNKLKELKKELQQELNRGGTSPAPEKNPESAPATEPQASGKRARCWNDTACTDLMSAQLVTLEECAAAGGSGWGPDKDNCTALK